MIANDHFGVAVVTSLYAGLLGVLFFRISIDTIKARRSNKISLGSGTDNQIASIVSAHNNFASYAIFLLAQMAFLEINNSVPIVVLHILGIVITLGRYFHYVAFRGERMDFKKRVLGMHMTLWPLLILSVLNVYAFGMRFF